MSHLTKFLSIFARKNNTLMQKIIIRYGLISGTIGAVLLLVVTVLFKKIGWEDSLYVGYGAMCISMSLIYFGIKAYRDEYNNGKIDFIKALLIGLSIMLISCILYSLMWLVIYYNFIPNFMDDYATSYLKKLNETGASQIEIQTATKEMETYKEYYKSPIMIFLFTIIEPTPVGILFSFLFAFLLKRK